MNTQTPSIHPLTALVLAASKSGLEDPVARLQHKSHKCLVDIDGIAMIERVIQTLIDSECFTRILISIEGEQLLQDLPSTRAWLEDGTIAVVQSAGNLADSILGASQAVDGLLPLVITTADNALHTPELLREFVAAFEHGQGDAAVGVTRESTVREAFPDGKFGFFQFKDGGYSFCNLFGLRSTAALDAATIFRSGGQFRKRPWRMLKVFGILPLILYKWRMVSLDGFMRRIASKLGIVIDKVMVPYAFGPIDVDNATTFEFSEQLLAQRRVQRKPGT